MNHLLRVGLLGVMAAAWVAPAEATTLAALSTDQMTDASDLIVRGTVTDVWTTRVDGVVWTRADLQLDRVYKGAATSSHITLESLGGQFEGGVAEVSLAARYSVGEEVFAFLVAHPVRESYGTVAMFAGKYTIRVNPADASNMVVKFTLPYRDAYDARFIPNPPVPERVSLDSLEAAVASRVSKGWDGKPIPGVATDHLRQINRLQAGVQ